MRYSCMLLALLLVAPTGCVSPPQRLRAAINQVRVDAGTRDDTVKVYVVLSKKPPVSALAFTNDPKNQYIAKVRFVLVVITPDDVTIYYKHIARAYNLLSRQVGLAQGWVGELYWTRYDPDFQELCTYFTGDAYLASEEGIVCDLQLRVIDKESASWSSTYPALFGKYGNFTEAEYNAWMGETSAK
jgi:hypothetical protein